VEFLNTTEKKFDVKFRGRVPHLAFRRIAARPEVEPSDGPLNDGLADAFVAWITGGVAPVGAGSQDVPPRDAREFAKYGWRNLARRESP
jgi:hypothetical protein